MVTINERRLLDRIGKLGQIGKDLDGKRTRLAADDAEKLGRDAVVAWMREAGLRVETDYIGNIFGIWETEENKGQEPVMTGSHIDTVINAGQYDGCYGVLAGIEVIQSLKEAGVKTARPMAVAAFTNEEGVRYSPDMMGSLVYAGGMSAADACASVGIDGTVLGEELKRIGYAGTVEPGFLKPHAFVELHIEQGPILDAEGYDIGAVENLQGISWQQITIEGAQNHAGTTPISYRHDAGVAAAKVITFMRERCLKSNGKTVSTTGCIAFEPNAVNVIPSKAVFTVDVRNPDEAALQAEEKALADYLVELEKTDGVKITTERLSRFKPVLFDEGIVKLVEKYAGERNLRCRRMTSGAGQDAQNMALLCPTAMIFSPSVKGISHNPKEYAKDEDLIRCARVFMDVMSDLAGANT
ncbi:Zn-dependent hydrolase [Oscillibacter valericigenes]|uniref:Zn-dependent hydrolase n=1 Tax=Oscillibacter valericigenes TaxID=351091 RepID=UPI001F2E86ED|nr:Zn-dependent hydrolase [Oscillibacter valericigenes]MCF2616610.1 Zn-dependent hydrolase [Oscillibacter valericigenes]